MYGLSTHIHTELKHFMDRLSMSYVLFNKRGIDNTLLNLGMTITIVYKVKFVSDKIIHI